MEIRQSVTIALAVYRPQAKWLKEQLCSLNRQTYAGKLDLLVWNDSPKDFDCAPLLKKYITRFSYRILQNGKTNGVTAAFAALTAQAGGDLIAYCDQDDIWDSRKIEVMAAFMHENPAVSACHCNAGYIDEAGNALPNTLYGRAAKLSGSLLNSSAIEKINDRAYQEKCFVNKNWALGFCMLVRCAAVKAALPFPPMVFHDQWLELVALFCGSFRFLPETLAFHRLHGKNSSETLHGVTSKADYYAQKLEKDARFLQEVTRRLPCGEIYAAELSWMAARKAYAKSVTLSSARRLFALRHVRRGVTLFELLLPFLPNPLFSTILRLTRTIVARFGIR